MVGDAAGDFAKLSRDLRAAGRKDLRRELYRALNRAGRPLIGEVRASALSRLPARGGLAARVAGSRFRVRALTGASPAIELRGVEGRGSIDLARLDSGEVRHPVFGNRSTWTTQSVPAGWWSDALDGKADVARDEIVRAVDDVSRRLEQG